MMRTQSLARTTGLGFALGLTLTMVGACGSIEPVGDETDSGGGGAVPDEVRAAFEESCGKSGCHSGASPSAGLDLTGSSIAALEGAPSGDGTIPQVTRGSISESYLALKMLDEATISVLKDADDLDENFSYSGSRMPLDGDFTNINNTIILGWIAGGELPAGMDDSGTDTDGTDTDGTDTTGTDTTGPTLPDPTDGDITFEEFVYDPIFVTYCNGCHIGGEQGGFGMGADAASALAAMIDVASSAGTPYVAPGDSAGSYVLQKMQGTGNGGVMPPAGMISAEEIQRVADWIDGGAL